MSDGPLIVQSDFHVLAEVRHARFGEARGQLVRFAELIKAPEYVHTYRITPLSIWNATAAGVTAEEIVETLRSLARYEVPATVSTGIRDFAGRYGRFRLEKQDGRLRLVADSAAAAALAGRDDAVRPCLGERLDDLSFAVDVAARGRLKQALIRIGYPADDQAGYTAGEPLEVALLARTAKDLDFGLRPYQVDAVESFHAGGSDRGGAGVVVLPCGSGKTIVGMACLARAATSTLILTTSVTAARQWRDELLDKTTLTADQIGEYDGRAKDIRPVTVATYQVLTWRPHKLGGFPHLEVFDRRNWGLIIYDEVHLLPAPIFQITAGLQARRRLGLTATLVREDGREEDVFALIGPRKADLPWKVLERQGWIAKARCTEIRLPLPAPLQAAYYSAAARARFRIASENPDKLPIVRELLERHRGLPALVIGMYVDQVRAAATALGIPHITGTTTQRVRDKLFAEFRAGDIPALAVSKVANFAVDLPDAAVAVQISGTFGSRQEEAQRLGRILRPKPGENQAYFYSLVSRDTDEQDFALRRQLFLCEQGYEYAIDDRGSAAAAVS